MQENNADEVHRGFLPFANCYRKHIATLLFFSIIIMRGQEAANFSISNPKSLSRKYDPDKNYIRIKDLSILSENQLGQANPLYMVHSSQGHFLLIFPRSSIVAYLTIPPPIGDSYNLNPWPGFDTTSQDEGLSHLI